MIGSNVWLPARLRNLPSRSFDKQNAKGDSWPSHAGTRSSGNRILLFPTTTRALPVSRMIATNTQ
jgi:hypothetical protein